MASEKSGCCLHPENPKTGMFVCTHKTPSTPPPTPVIPAFSLKSTRQPCRKQHRMSREKHPKPCGYVWVSREMVSGGLMLLVVWGLRSWFSIRTATAVRTPSLQQVCRMRSWLHRVSTMYKVLKLSAPFVLIYTVWCSRCVRTFVIYIYIYIYLW